MPFDPNRNRNTVVPTQPTNDGDFGPGISADTFQYARVSDASGTSVLVLGATYPIIARLTRGRKFTQGIRDGQSVVLAFENDVVMLAGVKTSTGKPDYHWWDARRFDILTADDLSEQELDEALDRF